MCVCTEEEAEERAACGCEKRIEEGQALSWQIGPYFPGLQGLVLSGGSWGELVLTSPSLDGPRLVAA